MGQGRETPPGGAGKGARGERGGRFRHVRGGRAVTDLLDRQVDHALEGVEVARRVCGGRLDAEDSRGTMATIEHAGDRARAHLVDRISRVLTTPLDREDLYRASRSLDDVLDNLRDLVREVALWEVPTGPWLAGGLDPARESLGLFGRAVRATNPTEARRLCMAARKEAGGIRRCYQDGLARVFTGDLTMDTLKQREVLRRIDVIGLRLTEAADALQDGLVKRSA